MSPRHLLPQDGAVAAAQGSPAAAQGRVGPRVAPGLLLVDVDAPARPVVGVHAAVPDLRRAGENLTRGVVERRALEDPEVVDGQAEVEVGGVADRRDVAGAVPGGPYAEELAVGGQLARRREAAD